MAFKDKGSTAESVTATVRKGKLKKQARLEAMRKEKERTSRLREAATKRDLLDGYAAFRHYDRAGVEATLEGRHGCDIEESDVDACIALQRANLGQVGGADTWDESDARMALRHNESRVLLLHGSVGTAEGAEGAEDAAGLKDAEPIPDDWVVVPSAASVHDSLTADNEPAAAPQSTSASVASHSLLGFVHLQFCLGEGASAGSHPLLCVLNMQLVPEVMGKGLGRFALSLVELIARRHGLELVMLYLKDGKVSTMRLSRPPGANTTKASNAVTTARAPRHDASGAAGATARQPTAQSTADAPTDDEDFEIISVPKGILQSAAAAASSITVGC